MITPRFSCSQTQSTVIISLFCPSVRASELDVSLESTQVTIHLAPYFLRLNFSGALLNPEDDTDARQTDADAHYDASSGWLKITLLKAHPGEHFNDLDLLPKLLAPRAVKNPPIIEVLSSEDNVGADANVNAMNTDEEALSAGIQSLTLEDERRIILEAASNDWRLPQAVPQLHATASRPYGFLDLHTGFFAHVANTDVEVILSELGPDAERLDSAERRAKRLAREDEKWDPEYYMADFADDEYIQELLRWMHPHLQEDAAADLQYTEAENMTMLNLPRREYITTDTQSRLLYLTLVTILFGYAYDARTTQHEPTPESAWTICSLVPSFAALDPPPYPTGPPLTLAPAPLPPPTVDLNSDILVREADDAESLIIVSADPTSTSNSFGDASHRLGDLQSALTASYRRGLAFPLHRSWTLCEACKADVSGILSRGKRAVIRVLLELKHTLDHHEAYYVFSKIWVDDFLVWISSQPDGTCRDLGRDVADVKMEKGWLGWDIESWEHHVLKGRQEDSDDE